MDFSNWLLYALELIEYLENFDTDFELIEDYRKGCFNNYNFFFIIIIIF